MNLENLQKKGFVQNGKKGFVQNGEIKPGVKSGDIVKWLKEDFELGHGHSMVIYALPKGEKRKRQMIS
ncbi:MAG: DUF4287 domain-containing protein [Segetibacter sp.]